MLVEKEKMKKKKKALTKPTLALPAPQNEGISHSEMNGRNKLGSTKREEGTDRK